MPIKQNSTLKKGFQAVNREPSKTLGKEAVIGKAKSADDLAVDCLALIRQVPEEDQNKIVSIILRETANDRISLAYKCEKELSRAHAVLNQFSNQGRDLEKVMDEMVSQVKK